MNKPHFLRATIGVASLAVVILAQSVASASIQSINSSFTSGGGAALVINANPFEGMGNIDGALTGDESSEFDGLLSVAAGSLIESYMFLISNSGTGVAAYTIEVVFDMPILGVNVGNSDIDGNFSVLNADSEFNAIARVGNWNNDPPNNDDNFVISADRYSITITGTVGGGTDPIRVITSVVPEPLSACAWLGLCATASVFGHRKLRVA